MVLGQEHIPKSELPGLGLQVFDDLRVGIETLDGALADLLLKYSVGRNAFFFDEPLDLKGKPLASTRDNGEDVNYQIQGLLGSLAHEWPGDDGDSLRCGDMATGAVEQVRDRHVGWSCYRKFAE